MPGSRAPGHAFYAAHAGIGSKERREAAEAFREVQQQLQPMVNFLVLTMPAIQDDRVLMPGSLLEAAALHAAIDASPNLDEVFDRAELLRLHTLTDNRYADVRTLAEKQRQNAFWLRRIGAHRQVAADPQRRARAAAGGVHRAGAHRASRHRASLPPPASGFLRRLSRPPRADPRQPRGRPADRQTLPMPAFLLPHRPGPRCAPIPGSPLMQALRIASMTAGRGVSG